jgi:hypothetical protein
MIPKGQEMVLKIDANMTLIKYHVYGVFIPPSAVSLGNNQNQTISPRSNARHLATNVVDSNSSFVA